MAATRAPADAVDLSLWPVQLDEEGLLRRYQQVRQVQQVDPIGSRAPLHAVSLEALDEHLRASEHARRFHADVVTEIWAQLGQRFAESRALSEAERTALVGLTARLRRHARVVDALREAEAATGPVELLARRNKAGAPAGPREDVELPEGLLEAARDLWPDVGAGTWETEGCIEVELRHGVAWRVRGGVQQALVVDDPTPLCRLDLVVVAPGAQLADCCLGALRLEPDRPISAWELGSTLSPHARDAIDDAVTRALAGQEGALAPLRGQLAQSQAAIRQALVASPDAPGASALRRLLWSWDR